MFMGWHVIILPEQEKTFAYFLVVHFLNYSTVIYICSNKLQYMFCIIDFGTHIFLCAIISHVDYL